MPERIRPGRCTTFRVKDGEQIFLAAVSDAQWQTFCDALGFADLKADPALRTNNARGRGARTCCPVLRERLAGHSAAELAALFERVGLPFAPIRNRKNCLTTNTSIATGGLPTSRCRTASALAKRARTTLLLLTTANGERPVQPSAAGRAYPRTARRAGFDATAVDELVAASRRVITWDLPAAAAATAVTMRQTQHTDSENSKEGGLKKFLFSSANTAARPQCSRRVARPFEHPPPRHRATS